MSINLVKLSKYFHDEVSAIEFIEKLRWPDGPICPHCEATKVYHLKVSGTKRKVWKCGECRKQFTVKVGTIFEDSHIPLSKWLAAIYMMCSSKKGVSAHQIHRELDITYKSAWFLCHRIRLAMQESPLAEKLTGIIEADETYVGPKNVPGKRGRGAGKKTKVFSLIQRDGKARSFKVDDVKGKTLKGIIRNNVMDTAYLMTDSFKAYNGAAKLVKYHGVVDHDNEYVRGIIHTNFAESYFSLLKRGILGTFHHVSETHMERYLSEFDFRWNTRGEDDGIRTIAAIQNSGGKRLLYR